MSQRPSAIRRGGGWQSRSLACWLLLDGLSAGAGPRSLRSARRRRPHRTRRRRARARGRVVIRPLCAAPRRSPRASRPRARPALAGTRAVEEQRSRVGQRNYTPGIQSPPTSNPKRATRKRGGPSVNRGDRGPRRLRRARLAIRCGGASAGCKARSGLRKRGESHAGVPARVWWLSGGRGNRRAMCRSSAPMEINFIRRCRACGQCGKLGEFSKRRWGTVGDHALRSRHAFRRSPPARHCPQASWHREKP